MKLNTEEREELLATLESQGWLQVLRIIEYACQRQDADVLKYELTKGPDGLVQAKARSEGARKLQVAIQSIKTNYIKKEARPV